MAGIETIRKETKRLADPEKAKILQRFFKTGPGQYGEGDVFAGITVPVIRKLVRKHQDISPAEASELLRSPIHEERLLALLILVEKARRGDDATRKHIYRLYLKNTRPSTTGTSSIFRPSISSAHGLPTGTKRSSTGSRNQKASGSGGSQLSPPFTTSSGASPITPLPWRMSSWKTGTI